MAYTTINKPSDYFNTKLYTGTGATQSISGLNFAPDFTWFKSRGEAQNHYLFDKIRGVTKSLISDNTSSEQTYSTTLTSFNSDGVTIGDSTRINKNTFNHVAWNWKANGAGVANTDGSISSTVSANTTSGFSIVKYNGNSTAGATIGHGLGVAPSMIIIKAYSSQASGDNWIVYHKSIGNTKAIFLNSTTTPETGAGFFNNTSPTSSVFTVGNYDNVNRAVGDKAIIAYCFADVQGYSKFGSYVGNGSTDGTFVYTGFKPAFVMVKNVNSGVQGWLMFDDERSPFNVANKFMVANLSNTEASTSTHTMDFLSNGLKIRGTDDGVNGSGNTIIYMAFAEAPLVGTNGVTAKAR